jgi:hypothetical protein
MSAGARFIGSLPVRVGHVPLSCRHDRAGTAAREPSPAWRWYWLINPTLHVNLLYTVSTNLTLCYSTLWPASPGAMPAYQHRRGLCRRLAVCA